MLHSGVDPRRGATARKPWERPEISILVFRATANGPSPGSDGLFPDQVAPPPPPPPPTTSKGSALCDSSIPSPGVTGGTNNPISVKTHYHHPENFCAGLLS